MKFTDTLKELEAKATDGPWVESRGNVTTKPHFSKWGVSHHEEGMVHKLVCVQPHDAELIAYLRNHAKEIINLLEAAEEWQSWIDRPVSHSEGKLIAALAALNKEQS